MLAGCLTVAAFLNRTSSNPMLWAREPLRILFLRRRNITLLCRPRCVRAINNNISLSMVKDTDHLTFVDQGGSDSEQYAVPAPSGRRSTPFGRAGSRRCAAWHRRGIRIASAWPRHHDQRGNEGRRRARLNTAMVAIAGCGPRRARGSRGWRRSGTAVSLRCRASAH